jgi:HSP20 family protein
MTPGGEQPMGDVWSDRLWPEWPRWQGEEYSPSFNIYEKDGNYMLEAEMPGIEKDDISINIDKDVITISGKKESKHEKKDTSYYLKESRYGAFSRSFQLPSEVQEDKVEAKLKDGVLNVVMPPKESVKRRKIEINA